MTQIARLYGGSMYDLAAEEQLTDTVKEAMSRIVKEKLEEFGNANPKAVKDFIGSHLVITDLEQLLTQTANEFPAAFPGESRLCEIVVRAFNPEGREDKTS